MEEFFVVVFGGLMLVAWGFGLIGVPMLFRRVKKLEQQVQELSAFEKPKVEFHTAVAESESRSTSSLATGPSYDSAVSDTADVDYETELANAYQAISKTIQEESSLEISEHATPVQAVAEPDVESQLKSQDNAKTPSWLERQLSTNLTAKIGAIVLIFGAVFLAKYAADIGVFTITARLWVMGLTAIAITAAGWRLVGSRPLYADIIQGTGFAVWLATWFATHVLYEQVGWVITLIACVLAVIFIGFRALKQDSQVLVFIGLLGGFIAPFIASSEVSSLWRLFSYMLVMNIAVALIAVNKPWRWFLRLGYLGSFLLLSLLMTAEYLQGDLTATAVQTPMLIFIAGLVVIYSLLATKWLNSEKLIYQRVLSGLLISVPSMAALAVYGLFKEQSLATAIVYISAALWYAVLWFKSRHWPLMATAIVAASIAIPFALNDSLSSLIYSIEGAAFFAYAVRQQRWVYIAWASAIQIAAAAFALYVFTDTSILNNSLYLAWPLFGAVTAAGLFSAWVLFKQNSFERFNNLMQKVLIGWSIFWWLYLWGFYCAEVLTRENLLLLCIGIMPATLLLLELANFKFRWPNLVYFQV
ncbi:MAG: putative membrane protein, partial [Reinekea sp.]